MMSMMPGQGMGAAGTGAGQSPMMPSGAGQINPQLLAMLAQMQTGQTAGMPMVAPPPGPMGAPPTGTPMANYIGAGGNMAGMMQHPMGMPQNPAAGGAPGMGATPGQAAGGINPQLMQLIMAMKGQQGGLPAAMPATPPPGGMPTMQQLPTLGATPQNPIY